MPLIAEYWTGKINEPKSSWSVIKKSLKFPKEEIKIGSENKISPYHSQFSQGATIVPKVLLTVEEKITEQVGVVGEKLDLSGYAVINGNFVVAYNHPGNQLATLVGLNSSTEVAEDAGRQVAMQVAAMNPIALNKDGVDARTIEREIEVGKELAIQEGKPADMAEKIAMGRLNKFFQENTLLSQSFVRDNKMTVEQFLVSTENGLTVVDFKRFSLS